MYPIPAQQTTAEINIQKSRFIATLAPAFTTAEARNFIQTIRQTYSDATHNVPAFLIGFGSTLTAHCHDDGEPSGTAGKPALAVLQGSGLGDAAVVITRYYGGQKLGTGGLVRAYSDAVRAVLAIAPLADKTLTHRAQLILPYNMLEPMRLLIEKHHARLLQEIFAAQVTLTIQLRTATWQPFTKAVRNLTHGRVSPTLLAENEETIIPR